jgi:hypothetical protein
MIVTATAFAQPRPAQPLPPGTSALGGVVTDAASNEPIAGCTVRASTARGTPSPTNTRSSFVVTGADGAFEFSGITDGAYFVMPDCPSHLFSCLLRAADGTGPCLPITLFKDQQRLDLDFKLTLGATVRGRAIDSTGKPVARATVRIGGPFSGNTLAFNEATTTADDGRFEVRRLVGGSWAIELELPPAPGAYRSTPVYYPGVLKREEAGLIELVAGKVKEGVIVTVPPILERALTVRIPPPDSTMTDVNVTLYRAEPLMSRRLDIDTDGRAQTKGLIDGRYVVMATALSGQDRWADYQAVDFLEESIEVSLQLRPAGRIRGRVVAQAGGLPPLNDSTIGAVWTDNDVLLNPLTPDEGAIANDGTFEIQGVFGRRLLQLARFDPDWVIQSVTQGRSDVTTIGIDVVSGNTAEVTVVVRPR